MSLLDRRGGETFRTRRASSPIIAAGLDAYAEVLERTRQLRAGMIPRGDSVLRQADALERRMRERVPQEAYEVAAVVLLLVGEMLADPAHGLGPAVVSNVPALVAQALADAVRSQSAGGTS